MQNSATSCEITGDLKDSLLMQASLPLLRALFVKGQTLVMYQAIVPFWLNVPLCVL